MEPAWAWGVLGLQPGASPDDVRRAFRLSSQLVHPDGVADLPPDVRAEAHRRMVELAEAYRVCGAISRGAPPPPPRAHRAKGSPNARLQPVGGQAAVLLEQARRSLTSLAPNDHYRAGRPTRLSRDDNAASSRQVVRTLEQVADAWPGTAEGDEARALLVSSVAAGNTLSARERAGHLVLVVDDDARDRAWDALEGRDELAVAQVVYAHPTVTETLRRRARTHLAEMGDWTTLADDEDPDIQQMAAVQLMLAEARTLTERSPWITRRERAGFDQEVARWRAGADRLRASIGVASLAEELEDAERRLRAAGTPARSARG
jgi:hypothetical protein